MVSLYRNMLSLCDANNPFRASRARKMDAGQGPPHSPRDRRINVDYPGIFPAKITEVEF